MKKILKIYRDVVPATSPRDDYNLGHMIFFHKRYNLGDEHSMSVQELDRVIEQDDVISLPVYMYDHSGITIQTSPFGCPRSVDSNKLGYIYCTYKEVKKLGITGNLKKKSLKILQEEIDIYDMYIRGEVYGFQLCESDTICEECGAVIKGELIDSCYGFYGRDIKTNGIADNVDLDDPGLEIVWEE